jgi:hypothetical protein
MGFKISSSQPISMASLASLISSASGLKRMGSKPADIFGKVAIGISGEELIHGLEEGYLTA